MTTEAIPNTRAAARDHLLDRVGEAAAEQLTAIEGGPLDGIEVLSKGKLDEVLGAVRAEELPALDLHTGEVLADNVAAVILVWAACPRCGIRQLLMAEISPRLTIDPSSTELSLRAKSKGRGHICGQLPLPVSANEASGQSSFELEDIIGDEASEDAEAVADPCPFPGCALGAEHEGDHQVAGLDEP